MREAVHRYSTERRSATVLALTPGAAGEIPAPSDDDLKGYYEANKASFRAPEYRSLNLLVLEPETLAKPDAVSEADAKTAYEANKSRFGQPERRTIQQISFPDEAAAQEARAKIESGEQPFEAVAVARGADPKELTLGTLAKSELFDPAVADAAFGLEQGKVSQPVKGRFGTVLLRVTAIEPGNVKPFDAVKDEVRKEVALIRARQNLEKTQDAIEDAARQAARRHRQGAGPHRAVDPGGRRPRARSGRQPVEGIPDKDTTLAAAFRADVGNDTEALRTKDGGSIWYDVVKVTPPREKPLDEVRDEVVKGWTKAETGKRLVAKSKELVERLEKATRSRPWRRRPEFPSRR